VEQLLVNCGLEAARWEVEQLLVSSCWQAPSKRRYRLKRKTRPAYSHRTRFDRAISL
jgi:hypothetical protein